MVRFENGDAFPGVDACAREPVHIIGQIQTHGLLFALSEPDLNVRQVSANVSALLGKPPESILGGSFEAVLGTVQFLTFQAQILAGELLEQDPFRVIVGNGALEMDCVAHRQDGVLVVELELRAGAHSIEPLNVASHIRLPLSLMEQAADILELSQVAAHEIRRLSGFERVMVYRFDEDWNGEVIAEVVGPSPISYLGLRFPASDIPAQARRLFLLNPLRAIADAASAPVPVVPEVGPLTGRRLDLTRSFLRSAASVHIEYLHNMGVQSSLTMSIVVQQRLWGMIACHAPRPHRIDCLTRSVCELLGQFLASQITFRADNVVLQARLTSRKLLEDYMSAVEATGSLPAAAPFQGARLLELLGADGLISRIDGCTFAQGATVEEALLAPVIDKFQKLSARGIASSNMLVALDRSADSYATRASGALYLGLSDDGGDYLLFLRREFVQSVLWAGNPDKAVSTDAQGALRPRTSFAAWQETLRGRSRPWSELELECARFLREQLLRLQEARRLHKSEEHVRYMALHDTLTGLLNRHSIHFKLDQCLKDAVANGSPLAVLFVDLDRFKHFNDTLGHSAGDRILKIVAARMQRQVRAEDFVGRLGGDEFVVILPGLALPTDAFHAAVRILRAIEEPLAIEPDTFVNITASIGLSQCPEDGTSSEELLSRSDVAMYRVKRKGGNALEVFVADERGGGSPGWGTTLGGERR